MTPNHAAELSADLRINTITPILLEPDTKVTLLVSSITFLASPGPAPEEAAGAATMLLFIFSSTLALDCACDAFDALAPNLATNPSSSAIFLF